MPKLLKNLQQKKVPLLLVGAVVLLSAISLFTISRLQGNAHVINYTGIVRGATQRLVKQELRGIPNDTLEADLDRLVAELISGNGPDGTLALQCPEYQRCMAEVRQAWEVLKEEIGRVRAGADSQRLFDLSESYFTLVDAAVAAAEFYSERQVHLARQWLLSLAALILVLAVLFGLYDSRQREMREALDEAESASRAKGEFLSRMSHEIRTPMNGIIGMTAIAKTVSHNPKRVLDCLEKIDQSSHFLLLLLNDILDMARIESGKIELASESFDLCRLVESIRVMFAQKANDKNIDFGIQFEDILEPCLVGDPLRISQIIINIVSNALKFTPENGRVSVDVRQDAAADGRLTTRFTITDTGIGMPPEFLDRIFQPFAQATATTTHTYGGTGLGLAISHNLLEMMGGEMRIASTPGQGSQFTILLYLAAGDSTVLQETLSEEPREKFPDFKDRRILLAEDNEINSEISIAVLENTGACVDHVWNGEEAIEKFRSSPPGLYELILMDIQMPVLDGFGAARGIRALDRPDAGTVPILALTANAFQSDMQKALQNGMNGHLPKPIDVNDLYEAVAKWLRGPS